MRRGRFKQSLEETIAIRRSDGVRINRQGHQIPNITVVGDRVKAIVQQSSQAFTADDGLVIQNFVYHITITPPIDDIQTQDQVVLVSYVGDNPTDDDIINHAEGGVYRVVDTDEARGTQVLVCDDRLDPLNFNN